MRRTEHELERTKRIAKQARDLLIAKQRQDIEIERTGLYQQHATSEVCVPLADAFVAMTTARSEGARPAVAPPPRGWMRG